MIRTQLSGGIPNLPSINLRQTGTLMPSGLPQVGARHQLNMEDEEEHDGSHRKILDFARTSQYNKGFRLNENNYQEDDDDGFDNGKNQDQNSDLDDDDDEDGDNEEGEGEGDRDSPPKVGVPSDLILTTLRPAATNALAFPGPSTTKFQSSLLPASQKISKYLPSTKSGPRIQTTNIPNKLTTPRMQPIAKTPRDSISTKKSVQIEEIQMYKALPPSSLEDEQISKGYNEMDQVDNLFHNTARNVFIQNPSVVGKIQKSSAPAHGTQKKMGNGIETPLKKKIESTHTYQMEVEKPVHLMKQTRPINFSAKSPSVINTQMPHTSNNNKITKPNSAASALKKMSSMATSTNTNVATTAAIPTSSMFQSLNSSISSMKSQIERVFKSHEEQNSKINCIYDWIRMQNNSSRHCVESESTEQNQNQNVPGAILPQNPQLESAQIQTTLVSQLLKKTQKSNPSTEMQTENEVGQSIENTDVQIQNEITQEDHQEQQTQEVLEEGEEEEGEEEEEEGEFEQEEDEDGREIVGESE